MMNQDECVMLPPLMMMMMMIIDDDDYDADADAIVHDESYPARMHAHR